MRNSILCILSALLFLQTSSVFAQGTPAFLVNTESIHTIDDGDATTDIVLKFGDALDKNIVYELSTTKFNFDDDIKAQGDIEATGTLSGQVVHANIALRSSGTLAIEDEAFFGSGLFVFGSLLPGVSATHNVGDSPLRWQDIFLSSTIHFGTASNEAEINYDTGNNRFEIDPDDDSVAELVIEDTGEVGINTETPRVALDVMGTVSGSALVGAGLTDCDGSRDRLQWDETTRQFRCVQDPSDFADFIDTTADAVIDGDTTDYWDPATHPNIDPNSTSSEIMVIVSVHVQQNAGNNGDDSIVFTIHRDIDADPTCPSTEVGPEMGALLTNALTDETVTAMFIDTPATTGNVRYTLCSDSDSASIGGDTIEEIHFAIRELNASVAVGGGGGPSVITLQTAYDTDTDGGDAVIRLTSADDSIEIDNPVTGGTDSQYAFFIDQHDAGAVDGMRIEQAGVGRALLLDQNADAEAQRIESLATTNAALAIDIVGDSDSPHLYFGESGVFDVTLYRFAADILKTDDAFYVGGVLSGASLTVSSLSECDAISTDPDGNLLCGSSGSYASITTDENSNGSAALFDAFEDANYPGVLNYTNNATNNISFTPSDGRFTISNSGTYLFTFNVIAEASAATTMDILMQVNGVTVYQHDVHVDASTDSVERTISIVQNIENDDYVEFLVDSLTAATVTLHDGTSASITTVLGGQGGSGGGSSGISQADADVRYVNELGDTMEGQLTINAATALSVSGSAIFNEIGNSNSDVRMEGDTDANLFFLDASTDRIGIGTATPKAMVEVAGVLSGAAIAGAGLEDCDANTSRLQWDSTTQQFSCKATADVSSFTDTTNDTLVDNNTTDYWDGTYPNITPSSTNNEVLVMVTVSWYQGNTGDDMAVFNVQRNIDADPGCPDTAVGPEFGGMSSATNADTSATIIFVDTPGTTGNVRYTLCSDSNSASIGAGDTVQRIDFTLYEINDAADVAEVYPTIDPTLSVGDVVRIDPDLTSGVLKSEKPHDQTVLGVVSTKPASLIGSTAGLGVTGVPVAIAGRVPVKISMENGPIAPGDYLTSSSAPGVAMRATKRGPVIGRALQDYDSEGVSTIMMFVDQTYYTPKVHVVEEALRQENEKLRTWMQKLERRLEELQGSG